MSHTSTFTLHLQFDGGSLGNPGLGYGSYCVRSENGFRLDANRVQFGDWITCNEAEYMALIAGLERTLVEWPMPGSTHVAIWSDSRLVVEQVKGRWRCKKSHLRELCERVKDLLRQFKGHDIKWHGRANNVALFGH